MKYKINWQCNNCNYPVDLKITTGVLLEDYLRKTSIICENCKCRIKV